MKRGQVVSALAVALTAGFVMPHTVWSYRGPGRLRDDGILSYPRFRLELPEVTPGGGLRSYTFAGVPSEEMSLKLHVSKPHIYGFATLERLEHVRLPIAARLFEEATALTPRREICSVKGSPDGVSPESRWTVTGSLDSTALYHCGCLRMPLSHDRRYTLVLEVGEADPADLVKVLIPTLEGGGVEFP